jgi:hydroxyacylglutathione hydrolase
MRVFRHTNSIFTSNTYIISEHEESHVVVIDPGDTAPILEWLQLNNKVISGIILTHSHYDHIYGLNDLIGTFPSIKLYVMHLTLEGLFSEKLNTSLYHEKPFILKKEYEQNIVFIDSSSKYSLWGSDFFSIIHTPGHTKDCISINIADYLFCGDALIPGLKVYKVKGSDSQASIDSINRICSTFHGKTLLLPGHGDTCILDDLPSAKEFKKLEYSANFYEIYNINSSI